MEPGSGMALGCYWLWGLIFFQLFHSWKGINDFLFICLSFILLGKGHPDSSPLKGRSSLSSTSTAHSWVLFLHPGEEKEEFGHLKRRGLTALRCVWVPAEFQRDSGKRGLLCISVDAGLAGCCPCCRPPPATRSPSRPQHLIPMPGEGSSVYFFPGRSCESTKKVDSERQGGFCSPL